MPLMRKGFTVPRAGPAEVPPALPQVAPPAAPASAGDGAAFNTPLRPATKTHDTAAKKVARTPTVAAVMPETQQPAQETPTSAAATAGAPVSCNGCGAEVRFCPCCGLPFDPSHVPSTTNDHQPKPSIGRADGFGLWAEGYVKSPEIINDTAFWGLSASDRVTQLRAVWANLSDAERAAHDAKAAKSLQQQTRPAGPASAKANVPPPPPPKPKVKRTKSGFMLFSDDLRAAVTAEIKAKAAAAAAAGETERVNIVTEMAKELGRRWKALTDEEKKPYNERAAALKDGTATAATPAAAIEATPQTEAAQDAAPTAQPTSDEQLINRDFARDDDDEPARSKPRSEEPVLLAQPTDEDVQPALPMSEDAPLKGTSEDDAPHPESEE